MRSDIQVEFAKVPQWCPPIARSHLSGLTKCKARHFATIRATRSPFPMTLQRIRIELARDHEFPPRSRDRGYDFVAPLDADGYIDAAEWRKECARCCTRRFWPGMADEVGHLVHKPGGARARISAASNNSSRSRTRSNPARRNAGTRRRRRHRSRRGGRGDRRSRHPPCRRARSHARNRCCGLPPSRSIQP